MVQAWLGGLTAFRSIRLTTIRCPRAFPPPIKQFREPVHCVHISNDGLVYVCDRGGDRIQVFTKQGKFLQCIPVSNSSGNNTAGSINFSPDPHNKSISTSLT